MQRLLFILAFSFPLLCPAQTRLFNGYSFAGWEGDTAQIWKIKDGMLIGGSLSNKVKQNDFLATKRTYSDFDLRFKFLLRGSEGFINSGVQFRSERAKNPPNEMIGYQADLGDGYWGSLYDESRRNKTIAILDSAKAAALVHKTGWNDYRVVCKANHIQIFLNGEKTVDYIEKDQSIPTSGKILNKQSSINTALRR
jgi:hypothetical protein